MRTLLPLSTLLATISSLHATTLLSPLTTFGNGDGWRAPNEIVTGDTAGTNTGANYNYLQTGSLERSIGFNPVTGNLIIVSRSTAGNGLRILNGMTGADAGFLVQGTGVISGGTFTTNTVGASSDGSIYVGNLTTNATTSPFKVYGWTSESASAPTVAYSGAALAGGRVGDDLDVAGSGVGTRIAAGFGSTNNGYAIIDPGLGTAAAVAFTTNLPNAGDFRLGITFAGNTSAVWGKQTSSLLRETTYSGTVGSAVPGVALTSAGEMAMDLVLVDAVPYLATIDANISTVRIYDMTNPAAPLLVNSATTTSGTLTGNGNATGSVQWGAVSGSTATLYAMSTNQGIQAFTFTSVPEPGSLASLAIGACLLGSRRRR